MELRLTAMNILARREHSECELRVKLRQKYVHHEEFDETLMEQVILELKDDNLLNDERFCEMFVKSRMNKGFGPIKIAFELNQKGVSNEIVQTHIDICPDLWIEQIQRVKQKKFGNQTPTDNKEKIRQYRYLYQRGYEPEQINKVLRTER